MMVPYYKFISELYLYSSGYLAAKELAKKIVSFFKLASQSHYDFGMRAKNNGLEKKKINDTILLLVNFSLKE